MQEAAKMKDMLPITERIKRVKKKYKVNYKGKARRERIHARTVALKKQLRKMKTMRSVVMKESTSEFKSIPKNKKSSAFLEEYIDYISGVRKVRTKTIYRKERQIGKRVKIMFNAVQKQKWYKVYELFEKFSRATVNGLKNQPVIGVSEVNQVVDGKTLLYHAIYHKNHEIL